MIVEQKDRTTENATKRPLLTRGRFLKNHLILSPQHASFEADHWCLQALRMKQGFEIRKRVFRSERLVNARKHKLSDESWKRITPYFD